jgi:hypothetical protein
MVVSIAAPRNINLFSRKSPMSKKYKRQVRKTQARKEAVSPAASTPTPAVTSPRVQSSRETAFNPDYTYVIKDLRRIGLLAGTFISILVILTFILR